MKKKVLVTGGAGFIGSHVANELLKQGYEVVILDDLSGGNINNIPKGSIFVKGSILDINKLQYLFKKNNFTYVFHLAAYAAEGLSHFIKHFNYQNNLIGSINLINESVNHNIKCFVFTSSIAVYGKAQVPMKEELVPVPEDSYGIAKYAVELELQATHKMFGLNYIIFRPHNVYGEHQNIGDKYRNVIGIFMNQIMQNKPMTIFGDGLQKRAFTYIADVAPLIAKSVNVYKAYNQIFNIGADVPYTVNYLAKLVAKTMGVKPNIIHLPVRKEVKIAYSDHKKIQKIFNYKPKVSLEEGLKKMAQWAKSVGPRKSKFFTGIEIPRGLPSGWFEKK